MFVVELSSTNPPKPKLERAGKNAVANMREIVATAIKHYPPARQSAADLADAIDAFMADICPAESGENATRITSEKGPE